MIKYISVSLIFLLSSLQAMHPIDQKTQKLFDAVKWHNLPVAQEAIENGADVNFIINQNNSSMLNFAYTPEIAQLLIDNGAKIDHIGPRGQTALLQRINPTESLGEIGLIETLLNNGASLKRNNQSVVEIAKEHLQEIDTPEVRQGQGYMIDRLKNIIEVLEHNTALKQQATTNPKDTLTQAVRLGLIDLTTKILKALPVKNFSNQELKELVDLAQTQYLKTYDSTYKRIIKLLQETGKALQFQLGLTGPELGISKTGISRTGLPRDILHTIGKQ